MAMIKCPECEKEISSSALTCPNCGAPNKAAQAKEENKKVSSTTSTIFSIIAICVIFFGKYIGMSDLSVYLTGGAMIVVALIISITANKKDKEE